MKKTFKERIYELTLQIPKGKVATYGQLARLAGRPKAARAVGIFMKTNPDAPHTPCHRVVAKDGSLTGYSGEGGVDTKREMLRKEGVPLTKRGVDMARALWSGMV